MKKLKYENPLTDTENRPGKTIENYGNLCPSAGVK